MQWNTKAAECQILLDVDCSATTYNSPVAPLVQATVEQCTDLMDTGAGGYNFVTDCERAEYQRKNQKIRMNLYEDMFNFSPVKDPRERIQNSVNKLKALNSLNDDMHSKSFLEKKIPDNRTETKEESLARSLLKYVNTTTASKADLTEAFCRDIESFNEAFQMDDSVRPDSCEEVPDTVCAVLYDSGTCGGGWELQVRPGAQRRLEYFSSDWKYRNDADTIGLRSGCTFTGFTGSSFDGEKMIFTAGVKDRWLVLENSPAYSPFHENIESFQCICRG